MKITISTKDAVRCAKPNCKRKNLHRHHRRHQQQFVQFFFYTHPNHPDGGARYKEFKQRYEEFNPEDIDYLCAWHHAEIHYIYDRILEGFRRKHNIRAGLSEWTWEQAEELMSTYEERYKFWVKSSTKGRSPKRRWRKWYDKDKGRG